MPLHSLREKDMFKEITVQRLAAVTTFKLAPRMANPELHVNRLSSEQRYLKLLALML